MFKTEEGSTARLLQLCVGYFLAYVFTGVMVKYFLGDPTQGFPGMSDMAFLIYNTAGSVAFVTAVVLLFQWYQRALALGRGEWSYIVPSGICTAVVIPATTLMYMLPISVMVAMVIMRGAVIVVSRLVDAIQIQQGILKKRVYWEENVAVLFAMGAVSANIFLKKADDAFEFIHSKPAMIILGSYVLAYFLRIYIMNYFKNTRPAGTPQNTRGFFTIEQFSAALTMLAVSIVIFYSPSWFGSQSEPVLSFHEAVVKPHPLWLWAMIVGVGYGSVAFVSVFIFMFKGRTATFAGLVNRLTSLVAGTAATLIFHYAFGGKFPKFEEWISLILIFAAVGFLTRAERKRVAELHATHEIENE